MGRAQSKELATLLPGAAPPECGERIGPEKEASSWKGSILLGGLSSRALIRLTLDGRRVSDEERLNMGFRVRDVIEAPDGAVLLLSDDSNGELLRLTPA